MCAEVVCCAPQNHGTKKHSPEPSQGGERSADGVMVACQLLRDVPG